MLTFRWNSPILFMRIVKSKYQYFCVLALVLCTNSQLTLAMDGRDIMQLSQQRHQSYPYVYEEQTMVLEDKLGHRSTKKMTRYLRVEEDSSAKLLLLFTYPEEVKGFSLIANKDSNGVITQSLYLPGLSVKPIQCSGKDDNAQFLGTDFSIESLIGESLDDYRYKRIKSVVLDGVMHYHINVYANNNSEELLRQHFVRQDNLIISKTIYFDAQGNVDRKQSFHDVNIVFEDAWQANHILMQDMKEQHQSLIKIERRVFSEDYVPEEIFTLKWLQEKFPYTKPTEEVLVNDESQLPNLFEPSQNKSAF